VGRPEALLRDQGRPAPAPPVAHGRGSPLVIVPAFNEQAPLRGVLRELARACPELDVLVVDDGSTDATAAVARAEGVAVAVLPFNLGVGGALQTGFRYAVAHGYGRALQFDADGQHDPSQVAALLAALDQGADLVIGSRFAEPEPGDQYDVGRVRGGAMWTLRVALRLLSGRSFSDTSSGFRAFSAPMLDFFAADYPADYMESPEALLLAYQAGFRVTEVPVRMRARAGGTPSNRSVMLAYHYLRALLSMLAKAPVHRNAARQPKEAAG
jgi:glycosyltransferase involved in cell wall biosynthesis